MTKPQSQPERLMPQPKGEAEKDLHVCPLCDTFCHGEVDRVLDELTRMNANQLRQINKLRALIKK